jgi:rod shape-determining protein MreB
MIGEQTAEEVKLAIGSALPLEETLDMEVKGRDQVAGLPRTINITSDEVTEALAEPLSSVVGVVKGVLEQTPPELASDIIDRGMVLTGGGALLRNADRMLTQETGVPCYVAENPMACVALGAGRSLDIYDAIRRSMMAV